MMLKSNHPILLRLAEIAKPVSSQIQPSHWLNVDGDDSCDDFCHECAVKEREKLGESHDVEDIFIYGGYSQECDQITYCEDCGKPLVSTLTDHGVKSVFDRLIEEGDLDKQSSINPYAAWELYEAFLGYQESVRADDMGLTRTYVEHCLLLVSSHMSGIKLVKKKKSGLRM